MEKERPIQGQSPYVFNIGLFYKNQKFGFDVNILYNVFGKRIAYVGDVYTNSENIMELPKNLIDLNIAKKIGKKVNFTFSIKNILNAKNILV